jgi:hypothetical protein
MQYVLYSLAEVLKLWAHTLVLFLPFFFGGAFVGMSLSWFRRQVGLIYGANMVGSGLGGITGVGLAFLVVPYRMPAVLAVLGLGALALWVAARPGDGRRAGGGPAPGSRELSVPSGSPLRPWRWRWCCRPAPGWTSTSPWPTPGG